MAANNVESFRAAHSAFNNRDFDGAIGELAEGVIYEDHARSVRFTGPEEFRQFMEAWVTVFPDARITEAVYMDAGDTVISEFTGTGTNTGPIGPHPPTGRTMKLHFCEVMRYNAEGKAVSGGIYYDQLSMLQQLGLISAEAAAG